MDQSLEVFRDSFLSFYNFGVQKCKKQFGVQKCKKQCFFGENTVLGAFLSN